MSESVKPYFNVRNELSIDDELVLFKDRIVIPMAARRPILQ